MHKQHRIFILFFSTLLFTPIYTEHSHAFVSHSWHQTDRSILNNHKSHDFSHDVKWDNSKIGSSYSHQHHFKKYTTQEFQQYFTTRGYTEKEILQQRCLYMFDEFVKFAQTYSSYKCTIQQLHAELKNLNIIQKAYRIVTGTYCRGLQKRIHYLYNQLSTIKTTQQNNSLLDSNAVRSLSTETHNQQTSTKNYSSATFHQQQAEYKTLHSTYRTYAPSLSRTIEKRLDAYNSMTADHALQYASKSYNLNNMVYHQVHFYMIIKKHWSILPLQWLIIITKV